MSLETSIADGQVGTIVAVEVGRHERRGKGAGLEPQLGLEAAVAVAQEDRDVVGVLVGGYQVEAAVARSEQAIRARGSLPTA